MQLFQRHAIERENETKLSNLDSKRERGQEGKKKSIEKKKSNATKSKYDRHAFRVTFVTLNCHFV